MQSRLLEALVGIVNYIQTAIVENIDMKKVYIEPGCITCGACEFVAPEVFQITDICHVNAQADLEKNKELIQEAARMCPVNVIKYEEK